MCIRDRALIFLPSLPIILPFISSLGKFIEDTEESLTTSEAYLCIEEAKISLALLSASEYIWLSASLYNFAKSNSIKSFFFVSSGYADPKSSGDYLKFKGLVEQEIKNQNFDKIGIMRPSFLLGNRKEKRIGEKFGIVLFKLLTPILVGPLRKMRPIRAEIVAKAMVKLANENINQSIIESNEIAELVR